MKYISVLGSYTPSVQIHCHNLVQVLHRSANRPPQAQPCKALWSSQVWVLLSAKQSCTKWHATLIRNTQLLANKDNRYLSDCHCNQANEAWKKSHVQPNTTDYTKEMHFFRVHCSGFYCVDIWVWCLVILLQQMLTMHSVMDLGGGCCRQLDKTVTDSQTMLKYAERSPAAVLFLSSLHLLVCFWFLCFIFQTTPLRDKKRHFFCMSPVPEAMQVPP